MEMTLTTPALLFSAISLLLLAYTNKFTFIANVIRQLNQSKYASASNAKMQIQRLRKRLIIIRDMQILGVSSFVFCTLSMLALFFSQNHLGEALFGISILLLVLSLLWSLYEVQISMNALNIELSNLEEHH
ncbi:MAG: DUF2721 domain-containing protein [Lentisphaeria bacterium]